MGSGSGATSHRSRGRPAPTLINRSPDRMVYASSSVIGGPGRNKPNLLPGPTTLGGAVMASTRCRAARTRSRATDRPLLHGTSAH